MDKNIALSKMMMYLNESPELTEKYINFVDAGMSELSLMLAWDKVKTTDTTRISEVAGAIAFYIYTISQLCTEPEQIKIADFTMNSGSDFRYDMANRIRDNALSLISDLLIDKQFYFGGVV